MKKTKRLVLLGLNEINFDLIRLYLDDTSLPNFKKLMSMKSIISVSEKEYYQLEPWIQWVSVQSGKTFNEHGIFRLGDIVNSKDEQVFESIERSGYTVGALSPMNARNELEKPAYFIPDPWTQTSTDGSFWSKRVSSLLNQTVNDNAQEKITLKSLLWLLLCFLRFSRIKNYFLYLKLAIMSLGKPWRKALFLDLLLNDIHLSLFKSTRPNFSMLFLNGGAHIQHHYLFNSKAIKKDSNLRNPDWYIDSRLDPFKEMLIVYDRIIGNYINSYQSDWLIATGLTQEPYDHLQFYWRLVDHKKFLKLLGLNFSDVFPRMTRDFLIEFSNETDLLAAENLLSSCKETVSGMQLFEEIERRELSLFVTLTFSKNIDKESALVSLEGVTLKNLKNYFVFVALKNGMHSEHGYAFSCAELEEHMPADKTHVKELYRTLINYFAS